MSTASLLQTFALNRRHELVSIIEVERGLACQCICPQCQRPMIARHGPIRAWHFAHVHDAECIGGAETALHLAAKVILARRQILQLPEFRVMETATSENGRTATVEQSIEGMTKSFFAVFLEQDILEMRIDALGMYTTNQGILIEIAVTHFVDDTKLEKLRELDMESLEIRLVAFKHEAWSWETLEYEVLHNLDNKVWLHHPKENALRLQALDLARQQLEPINEPSPQPTTSIMPLESRRYRINGTTFVLHRWPQNLALWKPGYVDSAWFDAITKLVRAMGGGWRSAKHNWWVPAFAWEAMCAELESAVLGNFPSVQRAVACIRSQRNR